MLTAVCACSVTIGLYRNQFSTKSLLMRAAELSRAAKTQPTHADFADWVDATATAYAPELLQVPAFSRCAGDVRSGCGLLDDKLLREPMSKLSALPKKQRKPPRWPEISPRTLQQCADELRGAAATLLAHPTAKITPLGGGGAQHPAAVLERVTAAISPASCDNLLAERRENMITGARDAFLVPGARGPELDSTGPLPWVDDVSSSALTTPEAADRQKVMGSLQQFKENTHAKAPKQVAEERGKGELLPEELVRTESAVCHPCGLLVVLRTLALIMTSFAM
eukprot:SAG31_NODE_4358_length_3313_cov_2.599876_2_plen_281_part_00